MKEEKSRICILVLHMFCLIALFLGPAMAYANTEGVTTESVYLPKSLKLQFSENQKILHKAQPAKVFIADPNPPTVTEYIPPPAWISAIPDNASTTTFQISYLANGESDLWGTECQSFPSAAKSALNTAAYIWAQLLHTRAPITIRACWGDFGVDSSTLGYSGGGAYLRDFSRAPLKNTWYVSSLANALYGADITSSEYDMHITFNSDLPGVYHWNYGTDGDVDSDEYDFLTVALHEICHGLGFSGSMDGTSSWGIDGYPIIYDVFTRDTMGTRLIDYGESYPWTLAEALTSGHVFFHGSHAMAANGGKRVQLFAPDNWMPGSSYSHLGMNFNHTSDKLMVYALSLGRALHYPGPITRGLLKDLGWPDSVVRPPGPPPEPPVDEHYLPYMSLLLGKSSPAATFTAGNLLISTQNKIHEYTIKGDSVRTISIQYPGGYSVTENARDIAAVTKGQIYVYNGTFSPYISHFHLATNSWEHMNHTGLSTVNNGSYGGIDVSGDTIFATDMVTSGDGDSQGIVAFASKNSEVTRFAQDISPIDLTIGLDGMLYSLSPGGSPGGRMINVYDPSGFDLVRTVNLTSIFGWTEHRTIAVDYNGDIFIADWDGEIHHISKTGDLIETINPSCNWIGRDIHCEFIDIDISGDGKIALGTRFGEIILTDTNFSDISTFDVGGSDCFVEFVPLDNIQ